MLVSSMLRARRTQAIAVLLLSAAATAAAVAGPVAASTVGVAVARGELAKAGALDTTLALAEQTDPADPNSAGQFVTQTTPMRLAGFAGVEGGEFVSYPLRTPGTPEPLTGSTRVVFRDGICAHIALDSGRCFAGSNEVLVDSAVARASGIGLGTVVVAQSMKVDQTGHRSPDGPPHPVTVVGTYHPLNPDDRYWGPHAFFPVAVDGERTGPALVNPATFDQIGHSATQSELDLLAPTSAFTGPRLAHLSGEVNDVITAADTGAGMTVSTTMLRLVDRIQQGQSVARQLVSVAFVPVVGLCLFVVYLAVAYGVAGRRNEIGLVNLRGLGWLRRAWMATGETLAMVLAGAPIGYLLGYALVGVFARARLGSAGGAATGLSALPYASVALLVALILAVAGQLGVFRAGVLDLLRGVPGRARAWRSYTVELLLLVLAVLGVVQLRAGGALVGVGLVVPGLVVATVAALAARVFARIADGIARFSLSRGRLGSGLAATQIARRPGGQRLFALLAAAVGLLAFASIAVSVSTLDRDRRADVSLGASAVVGVAHPGAAALLARVRSADPAGGWAMAVLPVDQSNSQAPPVLAVDATRLAAVATWTSAGVPAASVAGELAPATRTPLLLRGTSLTVDLQVTIQGAASATSMEFTFTSLRDGSEVRGYLRVQSGPRTSYQVSVPGCADGCRLAGYTVDGADRSITTVNLYGISGASGVLAGPAELAPARWTSRHGALASLTGGVRVTSAPGAYTSPVITVTALAAPLPVPVVSTQSGQTSIDGLDTRPVDVDQVAASPAILPALGAEGTLVDLEYLTDVSTEVSTGGDGQVWLGPHAPADAVARLRAAGLAVTSVRTATQERAALATTGPALGLQFYLGAAGLGMALALGGLVLVAAVDRRRRAEDLRALRNQGLPGKVARRVSLWGYLGLCLGSAVAGLVAAAAAWYLTGTSLPVLTQQLADVPPVRWPRPGAVLVPWAVAAAVLAGGAVVVGWSLLRAVTTGTRRDPAARGAVAGAVVARPVPVARERGNEMSGLAVSCRRVVQIYRGDAGDVVALSGVDLSIAPGETIALVGPSGSGKSTLIALLSGLMRPSAGRITIGTYDIGKLSEADISRLRGTQIGVVLQGAARNLLPYATLAKNIAVAQTRAARTRGIKLDHPERILDLVGLGGCGHLHIGDLTPGARQRAALAVGIATSPGLLLIDEPTSQLDTRGRDEVVSAIETVNAERGTTIVVVTHDTEVGARMGRAVTIRDGRVGAEGRGGQDFAVVASDGTVQLPPEALGDFPPGTLFTVDRTENTVSFAITGGQPGGS